MLRRSLFSVFICLLLVSLLIPMAWAVEIDPELREQFAAKNNSDMLPVLMIFDDFTPLGADFIADLDKRNPKKRRNTVVATLKKNFAVTRNNAASILEDPRHRSEIANVHYLYLANVIAFDATWDAVATLENLPDAATLFFDKKYDLTAATKRGTGAGIAGKGIAAIDTAWSVKYIEADRVWNELGYDGNGIVVGHIDTGVWLSHPDLANQLWTNPGEIANNGLDDDNNGFVDDTVGWDFGVDDNNPNDDSPGAGHGTHTAGSVVGDGTNGTLTGTAPGAKVMALKVWDAAGSGGSLGMIWSAEQYAVENDARIITMSLGFAGSIPVSFRRAERINAGNIRDAGVTFFNSSGNEHYTQSPPDEVGLTSRVPAPWNALPVPHSSTGGVISVGGTGYKSDALYGSSSRGPAKWDDVLPWADWPYSPGVGLIKPDVGAPGVNVNSTTVGGGYSGDSWSGTSMACPHAAGVAALMLDKNPTLSPAGIDSLMELNAIDLGAVGKDNMFGSGRLDAYAIVSAVPMDQNPDLTWTDVVPDPTGDTVLDPGETSEIAIELTNASGLITATGVTANLAVVANPYVTVVDGSGSFSDIGTDGGAVVNLADPFSLSVAAGAPQGYEFTMLVSVSGDDSFAETYDIPWFVGLPDWKTHDQGGAYLTVTDQGIIGYMSQDQNEGDGMGYQGGGSGLFVGSFWAGTDLTYVCNRDFGGGGTEVYEWIVADGPPSGRVRNAATIGASEGFAAAFTDAGHASSKPLRVDQVSMAFGVPENDQFVILEYTMTNEGGVAIPSLYNGVFCDFDLGPNSSENLGGTDASRNLTYLYSSGGTYMGIAVLGVAGASQNLTVINNPTYVYPTSSITDSMKMKHMRGLISTPTGATLDDWSALSSAVVSLDANGGQATVAYALVVGANLGEIQAAVDAANAAYSPASPVTPDNPIKLVRLEQNMPNPFNPLTEIKFALPQTGHVDLAVYDLSGRRVRTLVSGTVSAGEQTITWNGRDEAGQTVPSGMYFYRLNTGTDTMSRKMTLLK